MGVNRRFIFVRVDCSLFAALNLSNSLGEQTRQSHIAGGVWGRKSLPVVIGFEGAVLVETHVLGLLVRQLCQVSVKDGQVQTGHVLI